MQSAERYRAKAEECRNWAARALTPREKEDWQNLADQWDAMASEANPSGALPWKVNRG